MNSSDLSILIAFYQEQLNDEILAFWLPRCVDRENGGFFNCFDNTGKFLVSSDKYIWSQGRFVWVFSKLAIMQSNLFDRMQKDYFLEIAAQGADFLLRHALIGENEWRCVFLTDQAGVPKLAPGVSVLDSSIFADCFTTAGMAMYASAAGSEKHWLFSKRLYKSILDRVNRGDYHSLPYPLGKSFRMHSIPMILTNLACEMYRAALVMEPGLCPCYFNDIRSSSDDVLLNFIDEDNVLHEIISQDNSFFGGVFGSHINPGHTLEDMWFQLDAADILGETSRIKRISCVAKRAFDLGWDNLYGGYLHFTTAQGQGIICAEDEGPDEPQLQQVCGDWDSKLWWVHSEALYTALLLYMRTGDSIFYDHYRRIEEYVFDTFPSHDPTIREWIQIRTREGQPQDKVVALPVKDPYHIARNMILIIELLESAMKEKIE